jgi:hypothetical protein
VCVCVCARARAYAILCEHTIVQQVAYVILCEHTIVQQVELDILIENNLFANFRGKSFNYMCDEAHKHDRGKNHSIK